MALEQSTIRFLELLSQRESMDISAVTIDEFRAYNNEMELTCDVPKCDMFKEEHLSIPGPRGDIPVRIYWPFEAAMEEKPPLMVFYHGGGWSLCDLDSHENMCRYLCRHGRAIGISIGYLVWRRNINFPPECRTALLPCNGWRITLQTFEATRKGFVWPVTAPAAIYQR